MAIDPACGVSVDPDAAAVSVDHDGQTYYFCSEGCRDHFVADPEHTLDRPQPNLISSGGMLTQRVPFDSATGEFDLEVANPGELSVGDRSTFTKELTEADVRKFADASGDTNALHLNEAFARETRFGRRIVHGTLVAGTISAALAALPGLTIYLSEHLEFSRPVDIGDTVTATCEIVEELEDERYRLTTRVEDGDGRIAVHGTATVLIDPLPEIAGA